MTHSEINPFCIGLIGHSEGGVIASIAAVNSKDLAFIVLMGAPGVTGEELLCEQEFLIARSQGASEELIASECRLTRELFTIIKTESEALAAEVHLKKCINSYLASQPNPIKKEHVYSRRIEAAIEQINTPWFRYFLSCDPAVFLRQVKIPVLALNGEFDRQVAPYQNLPAIAKALAEGGNQNYKIEELPGLNHFFQTSQTGAIDEYAKIHETISPAVLHVISDWILIQINQ